MIERITDWAVPFVLGGMVTGAAAYVKSWKRRQSANDLGTQCLLRAEIIRDYKEYSVKGYCPIYAKESLERAYEAYSRLGGNDVAHEMYRHILELPQEPVTDEREDA